MAKNDKQLQDAPVEADTPRPTAPTFVLRPDPPGTLVAREDLHDLAHQLGIDRDDRIAATIVGDELHLTLTPLALAEDRLAAEAVDLVLCVPDEGPTYFPDDVHTTCADCGTPIRHRPHVPRRPKKVCLACGSRPVAAAEGGDDPTP